MSYSSEVLADSPTLYAKLDDTSGTTCVDSSGTGLNGVYNGSPTLGVAALINAGSAVTFNGSSGSASFDEGAGTTLNCTTGVLTVEAWIKTSQSGSTNPQIVCADDSANRRFMQFRLSTTGKLEFILLTSGGTAHVCDGTTTINDGASHHVVGTYDGTTMKVYVDGVQDGTLTVTFTPGNASPLFNIAQRRSSGSSTNFFNGTIDEVAYYKATALTSTRIAAHHSAGVGVATVTGAASLTITNTTTAAGRADHFATATLTITDTITTSAGAHVTGAASLTVTAAVTTDGTAAKTGAATLTITETTTTDGGQPAMGISIAFGENALTAVPTWTRLDTP